LICIFNASAAVINFSASLANTTCRMSCSRPAAKLMRAKLSWSPPTAAPSGKFAGSLPRQTGEGGLPTNAHSGPVLALLTLTAGGSERTEALGRQNHRRPHCRAKARHIVEVVVSINVTHESTLNP
jgi:hypothetical protein